jgi:hypothetical protein
MSAVALHTTDDLLEECLNQNTTNQAPTLPTLTRRVKVLVKPDMAKQWLGPNRKVNRKWVEQIKSDLQTGKFYYNPFNQIVIHKNGLAIDAQHRLIGIIETGIPAEFDIVEGVELPQHINMIDAQKERSGFDRVTIAGGDRAPTAKDYNAARTMETGDVNNPKANDLVKAQIQWAKYKDAINFASKNLPTNGFKFCRYEIWAAVGRAFEKVKDEKDKDGNLAKLKRLEQYCDVLKNGGTNGYAYTQAASSWHSTLINGEKVILNRQNNRNKIFRITMMSIKDFLDNIDTEYNIDWILDNRLPDLKEVY